MGLRLECPAVRLDAHHTDLTNPGFEASIPVFDDPQQIEAAESFCYFNPELLLRQISGQR
jgi:hypothetical protein